MPGSDTFTGGGGTAPIASPALTGTPTAPTAAVLTNSTQIATTAYSDRTPIPGMWNANPELSLHVIPVAGAVTTALKPTFAPIQPGGLKTYTVSALASRVTASVGGSTFGVALYSIVYSSASTYSANLVYQLNAANAGTSTGIIKGNGTTGAPASGATTLALDFVSNQYVIGVMASTVTTLTMWGSTPVAGLGYLSWTAAARSSVTDWPSSFTQASGVAAGAARVNIAYLSNADGGNWL